MTLSADLDYFKTLCPKPLPNTCVMSVLQCNIYSGKKMWVCRELF